MGLALAVAAAATMLAGPTPVLSGCSHVAQVKPRSVMLACGDGNFYVSRLSWTRWSAREALASGIGHQNDCTPDCARGRFHTYRVELRLSHVVTCVRGRLEFATIGWRFLELRPAHVTRTGSETLPCRFLRLRP